MAQAKKYNKLVLQKFQVQSFAAQQNKSATEYQRKDSWSSSSTSSDSDKDLDNNNDNDDDNDNDDGDSNSNSNSNNFKGAPISNRLPIIRNKITVTTVKLNLLSTFLQLKYLT